MIEINLLEQKKPFKLPVIMGLDLATINYKALILTGVLYYLPEPLLYNDWANEMQESQEIVTGLRVKERNLNKKIKDQKDVEKKLEAFNKQIEILKQRSAQVEKIIQKRTNPKLALERICRDIPNDMWFSALVIQGNELLIDGATYSFKSISDFINKSNSSVFFNKSLEVTDSNTGIIEAFGKNYRVENFKIRGIVQYSAGSSTL